MYSEKKTAPAFEQHRVANKEPVGLFQEVDGTRHVVAAAGAGAYIGISRTADMAHDGVVYIHRHGVIENQWHSLQS